MKQVGLIIYSKRETLLLGSLRNTINKKVRLKPKKIIQEYFFLNNSTIEIVGTLIRWNVISKLKNY